MGSEKLWTRLYIAHTVSMCACVWQLYWASVWWVLFYRMISFITIKLCSLSAPWLMLPLFLLQNLWHFQLNSLPVSKAQHICHQNTELPFPVETSLWLTRVIWWFNLLSILSVFIPVFHLLLGCVSASLVRKALLFARIHAQLEILIFPA